MILADGEDLTATALEPQTRLFGDWEFPPSDKLFALTFGIMIGPEPKDKKHPHGIPAGEEECFVKKYFLPHTGNRSEI